MRIQRGSVWARPRWAGGLASSDLVAGRNAGTPTHRLPVHSRTSMGGLRLLTISFCLLGDLLASYGLKEEMGMEVQESREEKDVRCPARRH